VMMRCLHPKQGVEGDGHGPWKSGHDDGRAASQGCDALLSSNKFIMIIESSRLLPRSVMSVATQYHIMRDNNGSMATIVHFATV
jgi:hypothetical protein